jgi:translocation and assembly module TamB
MKRVPRVLAAFFLALIPSALGTIVALLFTSAGTALLGRLVSGELSNVFRGKFEVQRISGTFIRSLVLDSLVIHDSTGAVFARVPQIRVTYLLPNLLAGRIVFESARLEQPEIHIVKRTNGRINFQEIFKLGEGPPGTGRPPLVELHRVAVDSGHLDVRLNWSPPDSAKTPAQVAAAIAAERAQPGRVLVETPDGYKRQVTLAPLTARLPLVRISAPDNAPLTFDIDSLATQLSDPAITITDLQAHAWTRGDSLAFNLDRAALPGTEAIGGGVVTWPEGPVLYDFTLDATRFDLDDLRWISPDFPEMKGKTQVTARSRSATRNAYTLTGLEASGPKGAVSGRVTVLTDTRRGLGVEGMNLAVTNLDLDVPRPYLDTIPLQGTVTGSVTGQGFLDRLTVDAGLDFTDRLVPGGAQSRLELRGDLVGGGAEGIAFDGVALDSADLDLRTIELISPAVALRGRLTLVGTLQGPWKNVTFRGRLRHQDGGLPVTAAEGTARLDTRAETVRFDTDLAFAPLAIDGIKPSYPNIPVRGLLHGNVILRGSTDEFYVNTALQSEAGAFTVSGTVAPGNQLSVDSLLTEFQSLDLAELRGTGPHTRLSGRLFADGTFDSLAGPAGRAELDLGPGAVMDIAFDTVTARARGADGKVTVDTVGATLNGGKLAGRGAIAWREPDGDRVQLDFEADTLNAFDAYLTRLAGPVKDTLENDRPLSGSARGQVQLLGAILFPRLLVLARGENLVWRDYESPAAAFTFGWNGNARPEIGLALQADELTAMGITVNDVFMAGGGYQDSLRWSGRLNASEDASISGGGEWWTTGPSPVLAFDSLLATLPNRSWYLRKPAAVTLAKGGFTFTPVDIAATDGSGSVQVAGSLPRTDPGELKVDAFGIAVNDIYALMQRDTSGVAGTIQADLTIGGTAAFPTVTGTASLSDFSLGDFGSPFVQAIMNYRQQRLEATLLMWKTGQQVMRAEADLPIDLALQKVAKRTLPGPLSVRVIADSTDLSLLEAFTSTIRRVRGTMKADVAVEGSWDNPTLDGFLNIQSASAQLPSLGVTYSRIDLQTRFTGDSITIDTLQVHSGEGSLSASGGLRLAQLTRPTFNLTFQARRFRAINQSRFLTLDASGRATLTGPVFKPRLSGRITADQGELHFADLISKRIVDLENPGDSGLIDLDLIRTENLGANFQNRFLDSLQIDNLQVTMGESFWLRSSEANIQLDGTMTINKVRDQYRYDGTMSAVRGNYALKIGGLVTRDFTVERGTVRYFGTPDLNAELDIEARHVVEAQTNGNEEIPVIAKITGTMLQPKLELRTDATATRANLSQTELVSYLMFGRPTFSLQGPNGQGSQYAAVQAGLSYLSSALSSELQRSLISDLGVPIDYLDIRPGTAGTGTISGQTGSAQVAQVAAGWQIGRKWFVEVVADLCTNTQRFYPNAEYRVTRQLKVKTSVEPAYSCNVAAATPSATLSVNKYQVGLDLLWERDY